jgi:predicted CXXCH cytochrome family protein
MRPGTTRVVSGSLALVLSVLAAASCTDEKIVFRDRELFTDPLPAAQKMLGYSDASSKLTTCGNCHVDTQGQWAQTAHADAWEGLQGSGHAQAFCEGCHTVNELGNALTAAAGYNATSEARYHDVQCESCHGPGLDHVVSPTDATVPLAALDVGLTMTNGCGECHQGTHHPFVEEWSESGHGQVLASPAGRDACWACHTGEDALRAWGVTDPYLEQAALDQPDQHMAITCGVCHDPHGSPYDAQLRFPVDVASEEQNLCMKCHHKRGVPDLASPQRGPHSPQGPLLLGEGGWWPPNLEIPAGGVVATHGSEANPRLCAGCHVNTFEVTDQASGGFLFQATGHLFEATPCLDNDGLPTTGDCNESEKYYQGCAVSGCHGSAAAARGIMFTARTRLDNLADQVDALLAQVPASEFSATDNVYTTAEGSRFNSQLARFSGTAAHNPFLTEALLIGSIRQLQQDYGLAPSPTVSLDRQLVSGGAR